MIISCTASQTRKAISSVKFDISLKNVELDAANIGESCAFRRLDITEGSETK